MKDLSLNMLGLGAVVLIISGGVIGWCLSRLTEQGQRIREYVRGFDEARLIYKGAPHVQSMGQSTGNLHVLESPGQFGGAVLDPQKLMKAGVSAKHVEP